MSKLNRMIEDASKLKYEPPKLRKKKSKNRQLITNSLKRLHTLNYNRPVIDIESGKEFTNLYEACLSLKIDYIDGLYELYELKLFKFKS